MCLSVCKLIKGTIIAIYMIFTERLIGLGGIAILVLAIFIAASINAWRLIVLLGFYLYSDLDLQVTGFVFTSSLFIPLATKE